MKNIEFKKVCEVFDQVEKTASRNEMSEILVGLYKLMNEEDAQIVSYLIQGRVAPLFVKSDFNYSEKSILNLLKDWSKLKGLKIDTFEKRKKTGDIGDTVEFFVSKVNKRDEGLSLKEVYDFLWKIINTVGIGSVERKNEIVSNILDKVSPIEARYFARVICGSLRMGVNAKTLLDVFSISKVGDKSLRPELDRAYGACADPGVLIVKDWQSISVTPGIPVQSRLVERVGDFEEVFDRLGKDILVQPKFDGLRCQIHKISKSSNGNGKFGTIWESYLKSNESLGLFGVEEQADVKLFTRNLEDVTEMFPEIVEAVRNFDVDSFILDSEILGWNYEKGTFLTYQETMQRRRKYDINKAKGNIPVKAMVFDILYENGESLLEIDTYKRVELLESSYTNTQEGIEIANTKRVNNIDELNAVFEDYIEKGLEGVIVKQKQGNYLPGTRNYEWIKLKKSMKEGMVDTVDLVVVGYYLGSGRRKNLGFGALLGAVYNEEEDVFEAICKVGTGFDDDSIKNITKKLEPIKLEEQPKNVNVLKGLTPDVWVEPKHVFTVEADEISRNIGKESNGIGGGLSLRFPRLVVFGRDKRADEATSVKELLSMFESQKNISKNA